MQYQQPYQCDICFQAYSPFSIMRVLPVTPITTLSGTATPIHVRTAGAKISVCRYCCQAYSNLEPCIDSDSSLAIPGSSDPLEAPHSPYIPDSLETPDAPSLSPSQPVHESDTRLVEIEPLPSHALTKETDIQLPFPDQLFTTLPSPIPTSTLPSLHPGTLLSASRLSVPYSFYLRASPVSFATSVSTVTFPLCYGSSRSPPCTEYSYRQQKAVLPS
jgi:hypothetical protein